MYRNTSKSSNQTTTFAPAMYACAAACFILILRTLSVSLSVLLISLVVFCGLLIMLALLRRVAPHREQA